MQKTEWFPGLAAKLRENIRPKSFIKEIEEDILHYLN